MVFKKGGFYEGEWIEGIKSGKGIYVFEDGSKYDGEWIKG